MHKSERTQIDKLRSFVFSQDEIKEILLDHLAKTENLYENEVATLYLDDTDCMATLEIRSTIVTEK